MAAEFLHSRISSTHRFAVSWDAIFLVLTEVEIARLPAPRYVCTVSFTSTGLGRKLENACLPFKTTG